MSLESLACVQHASLYEILPGFSTFFIWQGLLFDKIFFWNCLQNFFSIIYSFVKHGFMTLYLIILYATQYNSVTCRRIHCFRYDSAWCQPVWHYRVVFQMEEINQSTSCLKSCGAYYKLEISLTEEHKQGMKCLTTGCWERHLDAREEVRRGWRQLYCIMMTVIYTFHQVLWRRWRWGIWDHWGMLHAPAYLWDNYEMSVGKCERKRPLGVTVTDQWLVFVNTIVNRIVPDWRKFPDCWARLGS